jgi:tRNA-2-methylthio-N6-dimethylallyladenosine synthase
MNVNTATKIRKRFLSCGWTECPEMPDAIVFNTCCVRDTAEQKILSHIALAGKQKAKNKNMIIAVIGCLAEKDKEKLKKTRPYIDIIIGTTDAESVVDRINELCNIPPSPNPQLNAKDTETVKTAYIDITYGCENNCHYCIVPSVRGRLRCRPFAEIVDEFISVKDTAETIWLLGQNVNEYFDSDSQTDFADLLSHLARTEGNFKINFLSSHPKDFNEKIIKTIAVEPKIAKDIHLPIQSGCDKILSLMNRKYTVAEYEQKIALLRHYIPNVKITTDIICGFPTETEKDFQTTIDTVRRIKFNAAYIFPYSRRSGTKADTMDGQIPQVIKKARTTKLIAIMRKLNVIETGSKID